MGGDFTFQFSRLDELLLIKSFVMYLVDIVFTINTIWGVYKDDKGLKELYLSCFLIPNILAGIKSLHWYWLQYYGGDLTREEKRREEKKSTWVFRLVFFFFSPIPRFVDVLRLGLRERHEVLGACSRVEADAAYKQYLEAATTLCVLRFFEVFLMDAPLLTLKLQDLVEAYQEGDDLRSLIIDFISILYKLYKVSDVMMSYTTKTKKWWHMENPQKYENLSHIESARKGTINLPGKLGLMALHYSQIACKCLCYALVTLLSYKWLIYPLVGLRWAANFCIYFFSRSFRRFGSPGAEISRTLTAVIFGGIELFTHFTTTKGKQLGYILLFHALDGVEVMTTFTLTTFDVSEAGNNTLTSTTTLGDMTSVTGISVAPTISGAVTESPLPTALIYLRDPKYVLLALWVLAMLTRAFYYIILHPSLPTLSTYFPFCSRKERMERKERAQAEEREQAEEEVALEEVV